MNEDITMKSANSFSNNSSGYVRKVREPDVFNGERDAIILNAWIYSLELYFSLVHIDNAQEKLLVGLSLLRNDAQLWYSQLSAFDSDHAPQDWDELKAALRNEFIPLDAVAKARDRMASLVQTSSVTVYINEFRRLLLQLPDITAGVAQDKFIRGLKQHLRFAVRSHFPKPLEEAQRLALAIEGAGEEEVVVQPTKTMVAPQPPQFESMDLDAIRDLVNAIRGVSGGRRNFNACNKLNNNNASIQCYNCQGWGHMRGECPSPRNSGRGGGKRFGGSFNKLLKE